MGDAMFDKLWNSRCNPLKNLVVAYSALTAHPSQAVEYVVVLGTRLFPEGRRIPQIDASEVPWTFQTARIGRSAPSRVQSAGPKQDGHAKRKTILEAIVACAGTKNG